MSLNPATEALLKKRDELNAERLKMNEKFFNEVSAIEAAIEQLEGKKIWEMPDYVAYDDENPNYIRSSQEEI